MSILHIHGRSFIMMKESRVKYVSLWNDVTNKIKFLLDEGEIKKSCICGMSPKRRRITRMTHGRPQTQPSKS